MASIFILPQRAGIFIEWMYFFQRFAYYIRYLMYDLQRAGILWLVNPGIFISCNILLNFHGPEDKNNFRDQECFY